MWKKENMTLEPISESKSYFSMAAWKSSKVKATPSIGAILALSEASSNSFLRASRSFCAGVRANGAPILAAQTISPPLAGEAPTARHTEAIPVAELGLDSGDDDSGPHLSPENWLVSAAITLALTPSQKRERMEPRYGG